MRTYPNLAELVSPKARYCIVNADDFGASSGINRGVIEAHCDGILTSTSFMVDMPASQAAARMSQCAPQMSIGLHVVLTSEEGSPLLDFDSTPACRAELLRQLNRFTDLMKRLPTHLDSHHNIHRDPHLLSLFLELASDHNLPLREHSPVRYFSNFYGQWDGETHPEQISVDSLTRMLHDEVGSGFTELSCHPGYVDSGFQSIYSIEREMELKTLCSPLIRRAVEEWGIELINYQDLSNLVSAKNGWQEVSI